MDYDDRIDDAIRAVARAEASRDFGAQVRARIDAGDGAHDLWRPRLAAVAFAIALVVTFAWVVRTPRAPAGHAGTTVQTQLPPSVSRAHVERRVAPLLQPLMKAAPRMARAQPATALRAEVRVTEPPSDHERALEPLTSLDALSLPSIAPEAMAVADHTVAPLAPIAPLPIVQDRVADEPGEL